MALYKGQQENCLREQLQVKHSVRHRTRTSAAATIPPHVQHSGLVAPRAPDSQVEALQVVGADKEAQLGGGEALGGRPGGVGPEAEAGPLEGRAAAAQAEAACLVRSALSLSAPSLRPESKDAVAAIMAARSSDLPAKGPTQVSAVQEPA